MTRSLQAVAYTRPSVLESVAGGLRLGLETSRGATPTGVRDHPRFFSGFLTSPQVAAAGLLAARPSRLAEAIGTAAATGAYGTAWSVLREVLPPLLAALTREGAARTPTRGLGDLLAVAAECAERCGAHGELPHLAAVADRRGSSRLLTQARRLRAALEETSAA
jgi:hypothetical protein